MTVVKHWRVFCDTEGVEKDWYLAQASPAPTTCPTNTTHSVDAAKTVIVDVVTSEQVQLVNPDGSVVSQPVTSGGTPLFNPSIVPAGYYLYVSSAFDMTTAPATNDYATIEADATPAVGQTYELTDGGTLTLGTLVVVAGDKILFEGGSWSKFTYPGRGIGPQIALTQNGPGAVTMSGRFMDHIYILGGAIESAGTAEPGDWISMIATAPASIGDDRSVATGSGTVDGNANKVDTGKGFNIYVPAALNDGNWFIEGGVYEAGEINLNLCPVPNPAGTGFWHWDPARAALATPLPSIYPVASVGAPDGAYDLYDASLPLVRQANRISLMIGGDITPASLKGKKMLPHWLLTFTVMRASAAGTLKATARITTARLSTV